MSPSPAPRWPPWTLVSLRIVVGLGFVVHGYAKLSRGPAHFADIVAALGLPAPGPTAWLTTIVELAGGVALIVGAVVVPTCAVLAVVMLVALVGVHLPYGFSSVRLLSLSQADGAKFGPVGIELDLLYLAALATLAALGPGPLSIDRWRAARSARS